MKHVRLVSQKPHLAVVVPVPGGSPLEIKLNGVVEVMDRFVLAQRQAAWKIYGTTTGTS